MVVPVDVRSQRVFGGAGPAGAVAFGLLAGATLLAAEIIAALLGGVPPTLPLRLAASVAVGSAGVEGPPTFGLMVVGMLVHLTLSALYGWIYGAVHRASTPAARASFARQAVAGAAFGALLWLANMQVVARAVYPWFLDAAQVVQALLHALAFGAPLGLLFAAGSQREPQAGARRRRLRGGPVRHEEPARR